MCVNVVKTPLLRIWQRHYTPNSHNFWVAAVGAIIANGVQKNITFYFITLLCLRCGHCSHYRGAPSLSKMPFNGWDRNKWVTEESDVLTSERSIFYAECEIVTRPKPQHRRRHNYFVDFFVPTSRKSLALKVFHIFKTPQQNVCRIPSWFVKRAKPRDYSTTRRPWESEWPIYPATSMLLMCSLL